MFHRIDQPAPEVAANRRTFVGDGTPFLRVPGLLKVHGVRVSGVEIPLVEEREIPVDGTLSQVRVMQLPMIDLQEDENGVPTLLRSMNSNDGIWQPGVPIQVTGEWAPRRGRKPQPDAGPQPESPSDADGEEDGEGGDA